MDMLETGRGVRVWPETVTTGWRRFSSGLWRVPEGDIHAAYSGQSLPKLKVFHHDGAPFTCGSSSYHGVASVRSDCHPLIRAEDYRGPEPKKFTYEGSEGVFKGQTFRLGPRVVFVSSDPTPLVWRPLLRSLYADGGHFASQATYGSFLETFQPREKPMDVEQEARRLEASSEYAALSKQDLRRVLDGEQASTLPDDLDQLKLPF